MTRKKRSGRKGREGRAERVPSRPAGEGVGDDAGVVNDRSDKLDSVGPSHHALAKAILQRHFGRIRYCPEERRFRLINKESGLWEPDVAGRLLRLGLDAARHFVDQIQADDRKITRREVARLTDPRTIEGALRLIGSEPGVLTMRDEFDPDPYLLVVRNGVVKLMTGTLCSARPEDLLTMASRATFDPKAKCPRFQKFLDETFEKDRDVIDFVQRVVGYALSGDTSEQAVFMFSGSGANGKSTLINVFKALAGTYCATARRETFSTKRTAGGHTEDLARLAGKRSAVVHEMEGVVDEALLKEMTGGDDITARALYRESFEFRPRFKLIFTSNALPRITSNSPSTWRRIRVVHFLHRVPESDQDGKLIDKLLDELPGILNWAIRGFQAWKQQGLKVPEAVRRATDEYRGQEDVLGQFLEETCVKGAALETPTGYLYFRFVEWCKAAGVRALAGPQFNAQMIGQGFEYKRRKTGRFWLGLRPRHPGGE